MSVGDWVRIVGGYWKGNEGEVSVANERFVWVRLLDGDEVICLSNDVEIGQMPLKNSETEVNQ